MKKEAVILAVGVVCLAAGFLLNLTWESFLESKIHQEFILSETSKTYEPWIKTSIPIYIKFYFWNWTNPSKMREPGYKPVMQECGPYTFREETKKVDVVWNRNGTVTYKRRRLWFFDPDLSGGTLEDQISTINVVAKSAAFITRYAGMITKLGLNVALSSTQTLQVVKPVGQLLFEGYQNSLIDTAKTLPNLAGINIPFDRFGWFYKRNGSTDFDGVFNIETGINGMEHFGKIRRWNYETHTPFFEGECGAVRGSGGEFFPPKRSKSDIIELFSPDLCRYVPFYYSREDERYGVNGYRYEMNKLLVDNGEEDESHTCFCGGECAPPGALNVSSCRLGAPAFVSFPHFHLADPSYTEAIEGMKPDPEKHEGHIILEPKYGIPLDVAARFQINILMQPFDGISMFHGLNKTYFPIMWFEQTAGIPPEMAEVVKILLLLPLVGIIASFVLIGLGVILIAGVALFKYYAKKKELPISEETRASAEPMLHVNGTIILANGKENEKNEPKERWFSTKM